MFLATLRTAFASLLKNRMRTALTTLGIAIGIAAVICTVALGAGSAAQVQAQLDNLGDDFIWIQAGSFNAGGVRSGWGGGRTLHAEDATALTQLIPDLAMCSPGVNGREQLIAGGQNWNTRYLGVSSDYFDIRKRTMLYGTPFAPADVNDRAKVLVLGETTSERLFGDENPVGREVRMGRFPYRILGVMQAKGASGGGVDRDDLMLVPYTTAQRSLDRKTWIDDIWCSAKDPSLVDRAEVQITSVLRMQHGLGAEDDDDFSIRKPEETIQLRAQTSETLALMLVAIGAVSLVVGGVGIMNIMLVSVTERTREIGIRLAIGARVSDIRLQFLVEAAALGLIGGAGGVVVGWLGSSFLASWFGWPTVVSTEAIGIAVVTALGAGLVFGYYPAHHASDLDPIDALRTEA